MGPWTLADIIAVSHMQVGAINITIGFEFDGVSNSANVS
jgi:hypothetical protein